MRRAFTLVELAIVLAVISVVAAYVTPDFIEMARTGLAERAAADLIHIQDAARWFYHESPGPTANPVDARWPGESAPGSCTMGTANAGRNQLVSGVFLTDADFINPWSRPYRTSLWTPTGAPGNCRFVVATEVPDGVARVLAAHAPLAACERVEGDSSLCPGSPGAGYDLCCSRLVKPGFEASETEVLESVCEHILGGKWDGATESCDPYGNWEPNSNCVWISDRTAGGGGEMSIWECGCRLT